MITEFNTTPAPAPAPSSSTPGTSGNADKLIMVAVVLVAGYFAYKYLIQKPAEKEKENES
jgi:uncharacterized protein HemX